MKKKLVLFSLLILMLACGKNIIYEGDSMLNYPDMKTIVRKYLDTTNPILYTKIVKQNNKSDSSKIANNKMPWDDLFSEFLRCSLYDSSLDRHYGIDILQDTLLNSTTVLYSTLDPELYVQSISISSDRNSGDLEHMYIETDDPGFFSSVKKRILFVPNKTIQIQERRKSLFSKEKTKIVTYKFE